MHNTAPTSDTPHWTSRENSLDLIEANDEADVLNIFNIFISQSKMKR